jgi:hypothetical protein
MEEPRRKVWDKPSVRRLLFFVRLPNDDEVGLAVADVSAVVAAMTVVVVVVAFKEGVEVGTSGGVTEVSLREAAEASAEEHRRVLRIQGSTLRGSMGQAKSTNGIYTSSIKCKN